MAAWWWRPQDALARRVRQRVLPAVRDALDLRPGVRLLDLGGGTGATAELLGAAAVVLEPHAGKCAYGARRRPALPFARGVGEALPFRDASFDRALAVVSFHHMPDQAGALAEARRVLRPGGRLVLLELDPSEKLGGRIAKAEGWLGFGSRFVRPEELAAMLRAAGFAGVGTGPAPRGYLAWGEAPR